MARKNGSESKSDFIREHMALPAAEIIVKAKAAGLGEIKPGLVYTVKSQLQNAQKSRQPTALKRGRKAKPKQAPVSATAPTSGGVARPNASAFVKSLPANMPVAEVMDKARAAGYTFPPGFVPLTRSSGSKGGTRNVKKSVKTKPVVAERTPAAAATGRLTPSRFVRSQPTDLSAKDLQAMGAKHGLQFSTALVYAVRKALVRKQGATKVATASAPTVHAKRGRKPQEPAVTVAVGSGVKREGTFQRLAMDIGLARARELLTHLDSEIEAFFARG